MWDRAPGKIAAVILAAGLSARMGTSKPLLPLGAATAVERVIATAFAAGVHDVVVVTGHRAEDLAPILEQAGAQAVYNPDYETGMFSSVRAGAAALGDAALDSAAALSDTPACDAPAAFFMLPVDCALVSSNVLRQLLATHLQTPEAILHPVCCGVRGHPPLIPGHHARALARADAGGDLQTYLERHREVEREVDVQDLTILLDMDTPKEYERLRRFAETLDGAGEQTTAATSAPAFDPGDALYLLRSLELPERVVRHSQAVAAAAVAMAEALKASVPALDTELVRLGGLLHDMAKAERKHAAVAQMLLGKLGLPRLGAVVGAHMVLPPEQADTSLPTEEQLVYLADKLTVEDRISTFNERAARTLQKHAGDPQVARGVESRMAVSRLVAERVEAFAGRALAEILREAAWPEKSPQGGTSREGGTPDV